MKAAVVTLSDKGFRNERKIKRRAGTDDVERSRI